VSLIYAVRVAWRWWMKKVEIYKKAIERLADFVEAFESELEKPRLRHGGYVYEEPTVKHVCLLKAVRIVSGANALLVLLEAGYVTEMGVLIRTVGDCVNDIYFLLEKFPEIPVDVEKYIANFFSESIEDVEILEDNRKVHRTKVRKIHASRARLLSEHTNLYIDRDMVYRIYSAYSGYVHAGFQSIMELYGGLPPKFHLDGIKGTPRVLHWEQRFISLLRRATLVFGYMAEKYNKPDLVRQVRNLIDWFDKEIMYVKQAT